eukprot:TCALIF_11288-PA protein Name:"Similar to Tmem50b Transmembrane protein 50B (Mus musculus)" AED:0.13 eAED:0.13 QI:532/0.5/0.66/1/0/0.66/3/0/112
MAGCLDNFQMPSLLENLNITERRNKLSSILAGLLFFLGWWIAIDAAVCYHDDMLNIFHICGVFGSLSMFMREEHISSQDYISRICHILPERFDIFLLCDLQVWPIGRALGIK